MNIVVFNTDNDEIVKENLICHFSRLVHTIDGSEIRLYKVVERFYFHPESDKGLLIPRLETVFLEMFPVNSIESAKAQLLLAANNNCL